MAGRRHSDIAFFGKKKDPGEAAFHSRNRRFSFSSLQHHFFNKWEEATEERERAREVKSEGFMLKRWDSPYLVGRKKGDWWKWKVEPLTVDAVLTYAMRGHGRRSNLFTDYTFALWEDE